MASDTPLTTIFPLLRAIHVRNRSCMRIVFSLLWGYDNDFEAAGKVRLPDEPETELLFRICIRYEQIGEDNSRILKYLERNLSIGLIVMDTIQKFLTGVPLFQWI
jgi:hypothetical protein